MTDVASKKSAQRSSKDPDKSLSQNADVMEHFKKRLIHQIENPEKTVETLNNEKPKTLNSDDEKSNEKETASQTESVAKKTEQTNSSGEVCKKTEEPETGSSTIPSAAGVDKKKEVIQKIARRKSVSRSQFRHDNISLYKLGSSKTLFGF